MDTIPFVVNIAENKSGEKGIFMMDNEFSVRSLPIDTLKENLKKVCHDVTDMLDEVKNMGTFRLKEVVLEVEISAEGGVALIGTAQLGGKGAIKITFAE